MSAGAASQEAIWQEVECGGYAADLSVWAELASAAGIRPVLQRAGSVLGELDNQHRETGLTRQERKIAGLAVRGLSNKEIAEQLFLTVRTVEFHLSNVYRKLGIAGRRQLAGVMNAQECA